MVRPLIVMAMREELKPFLRVLRDLPGTDATAHSIRTRAVACDVLLTGPGKANVRDALAEIATVPSEIIHCGIAGGISETVEIGETYRIDRLRAADVVLDLPPTAVRRALAAIPVRSLVTVPSPVGSTEKLLMRSHRAADLCDMESFHVYAWCREKNVPYTGVRSVSDRAEDDVPYAVRASWDGRAFRTRVILGEVLAHPSLLFPLLDLARATRAAAAGLARALAPLLENGWTPLD